ncbi:leucine-rich repeat transmembrane protein kinase [Actinidia rufa]|uniref:Leucine-rich repeat transmembrane protein kinase n=1 Tax=Actinidia rufa TaxID=165716 RepID=A0A7J0HCX1_9ERIC|nr:leucine-rich repeat transmembrane protein kinase [Actinidia rufa]
MTFTVKTFLILFAGKPDFFSGNLRTISYFDFHTLRKATKNFYHGNLLGRGGFGPVYQGKLEDGTSLAVKKLSVDKSQQGESEFLAEVRGYTAPEYAIRGELSEKADIYSFGVLVLEIIGCRKNTDLSLPSEMQYLPEYAWKLHERSKVIDLVDPRMVEDGYVEKDVLRAIHVALLCLQPHASLRPPMSEIVAFLTCTGEMIITPVKPTFLERRPQKDDKLSWDAISEDFPSPPTTSHSPPLPQP